MPAMDIQMMIKKYVDGNPQTRDPDDRDASYDYCFNYFQSFRERDAISSLANADHMETSCLQLGFYLASWGMYRGSTYLLTRSSRHLEKFITVIASSELRIWEIDCNNYTDENISLLLDMGEQLRNAGESKVSDTLLTKIMMGVFGVVPAFDTYFIEGAKRHLLPPKWQWWGKETLIKIAHFYGEHSSEIDEARLFTLDFASGQTTNRRYTRAKIVDMVLNAEGYPQSSDQPAATPVDHSDVH